MHPGLTPAGGASDSRRMRRNRFAYLALLVAALFLVFFWPGFGGRRYGRFGRSGYGRRASWRRARRRWGEPVEPEPDPDEDTGVTGTGGVAGDGAGATHGGGGYGRWGRRRFRSPWSRRWGEAPDPDPDDE